MLKPSSKNHMVWFFLGIPSNFTRRFYRDVVHLAPVFSFELKRICGGLTGKKDIYNDPSYIYIASDD